MKRVLYCFLVILLAGMFTSCRHNIVYSEFISIPSGEWSIDSLPRFDFAIEDNKTSYDIILHVRHTERYPYQNMWLFVQDNRQHSDTIEFYLADDRGRWLGDKHHGFIEMPVLYESNYHFPDTGKYCILVQHGMRDSVLCGVMDIGVEIVKGEK
jgi:gliding motility-associated lipoprotein GldH